MVWCNVGQHAKKRWSPLGFGYHLLNSKFSDARCLVLYYNAWYCISSSIFNGPELHWYCRSGPEWLTWQSMNKSSSAEKTVLSRWWRWFGALLLKGSDNSLTRPKGGLQSGSDTHASWDWRMLGFFYLRHNCHPIVFPCIVKSPLREGWPHHKGSHHLPKKDFLNKL